MLQAKSERRRAVERPNVTSAGPALIPARIRLLLLGQYLRHIRSALRANAIILLPALVFFALLVAVNWQLFVTPLIENGDAAANAIQVQNAKHLHELLGNYSRWHFHHPGPFFFYLFGAGEAILYNLLHLVPAPLNGEYLAQITFNVICLFLAIYIFHVNVRRPLFPAFAISASTLFLYVVYTAIPYSAINPIWPPYVGIFCYLLLASSAASVAAGTWKHLPILAASAMILIHGHVAQVMFASVLAIGALSIAAYREFQRGNLRRAANEYRYQFLASATIVALFLTPIAIDYATRHPNNIHQIRLYLRQHRGEHNSVPTTLLYVASFFTFYQNPEIPLSNPSATFQNIFNPQQFLSLYWSIFLFLGLFTLISYFGRLRDTSLFVRFVFAESVLVIVMFIYWSWRITGGMYNFNGFFFFSVQLLVLLGLGALICNLAGPPRGTRREIALACASAAPLVLLAGVLNGYPTDPNVLPVVSQLKARHLKRVELVMQGETWPTAAGVASYLNRAGIFFCVEPDWEFTFGPAHTCADKKRETRVRFTEGPPACKAPCSVIYNNGKLYVTERPPEEQYPNGRHQ
jgi:hypothetical protein